MTSPNQVVPKGASTVPTTGALQDITEETAKDAINQPLYDAYGVGNKSPFSLIAGLFSGFLNLGHLLGSITSALTGNSSSGGIGSLLSLLSGWRVGVEGGISSSQTTANAAIAAAQAADNKVTALITGGVRTIYTSNFVYTKPANLVKLGIIIIGGGAGGAGSRRFGAGGGGVNGSYQYLEVPAAGVPATVTGTVGGSVAGSTTTADTSTSVTSFGSLISSSTTGIGAIVSSAGYQEAAASAPGSGGPCNVDGGSSALAVGGAGGVGAGNNGGAGANAPVTGVALAGGGGGGGGYGLPSGNTGIAAPGRGGPGGFPGGGGGAGGATNYGTARGGASGPGLIALIEFLS